MEKLTQPLAFEDFSSNDFNSFFEDCSITLIDETEERNAGEKL